jgi:hypothetical protein
MCSSTLFGEKNSRKEATIKTVILGKITKIPPKTPRIKMMLAIESRADLMIKSHVNFPTLFRNRKETNSHPSRPIFYLERDLVREFDGNGLISLEN